MDGIISFRFEWNSVSKILIQIDDGVNKPESEFSLRARAKSYKSLLNSLFSCRTLKILNFCLTFQTLKSLISDFKFQYSQANKVFQCLSKPIKYIYTAWIVFSNQEKLIQILKNLENIQSSLLIPGTSNSRIS